MSIFAALRPPARALPFVIALAVSVFIPAAAQAIDYKEVGALGRWQLTKALDFADIASLDEREAKQLVGRVFTIQKDHVRFGKRDCGAPELTADSVDPAWFMREYARAGSAELHLPTPVTVVHLACTFAFVREPDRMIIHWKGWFFDAKRMR